jgi:hypothetical protein
MVKRNVVPCNGCVACCRTQKAPLFPEHGDDVSAYRTVPTVMADGRKELMLARKADGACVYLGEQDGRSGCTIWERAPWVCRRFDCRKLVLGFGSSALMVEVLEGYSHDAVVKAGLARARIGKADESDADAFDSRASPSLGTGDHHAQEHQDAAGR